MPHLAILLLWLNCIGWQLYWLQTSQKESRFFRRFQQHMYYSHKTLSHLYHAVSDLPVLDTIKVCMCVSVSLQRYTSTEMAPLHTGLSFRNPVVKVSRCDQRDQTGQLEAEKRGGRVWRRMTDIREVCHKWETLDFCSLSDGQRRWH